MLTLPRCLDRSKLADVNRYVTLGSHRARAEVMRQTNEIAIGVLHGELANANLVPVTTIPLLFKWQEALNTCADNGGVQFVEVRYVDFKIHAATERLLEFRFRPKTILSMRLLQHDLSPVAVQERKPVFWAIIQDLEAEKLLIEVEAPAKVRADELRYKCRSHAFTTSISPGRGHVPS